ncbi:MAG TPA: hypothetical protein VK137_16295, partial [Planctomycetaceae bacterium]|nr:hypothetical protein [Planctomycetaceae bacterium]
VGESVTRAARSTTSDGAVTLTRLNGERQRLSVQDIDGTPMIVLRDLVTPGLYSLSSDAAPNELERIAINIDPRESDPRRLDRKELSLPQASASPIAFRDATSPALPVNVEDDPFATSLARGLLVAVFVLLLIEQSLAWRFAAGVIVAVVATVLASVWLSSGSAIALVITAGVCGLAAVAWITAKGKGKQTQGRVKS